MSLHCVISWDQESSPEDVETIGELDSRLTELRPALQDQEQPAEQEEERPNHVEIFVPYFLRLSDSVPDPDPHIFGPPGSFYHQAKVIRKTLIPTVL